MFQKVKACIFDGAVQEIFQGGHRCELGIPLAEVGKKTLNYVLRCLGFAHILESIVHQSLIIMAIKFPE